MPFYIFIHPDTGEEKEVQQRMTEPHVYIDENGIEWERVFTAPQGAVGLNHDPFNSNNFLEKSRHANPNNRNLGELQKRAAEDSYRRAEKNSGVDPIKKEYFKDYSKKRKGKKHMDDPSR